MIKSSPTHSCIDKSWVCLNTYGSIRHDEGFAAVEGLVRDQDGRWIIGFSKYFGNYTVIKAKLWSILDGLKLIADRRDERVLIQMDSLQAAKIIQDDSTGNSNSTLIRRIRQTLPMVKQWKIQHFPREENTITDNLVKMVRDKRPDLKLFEDPLLST
ncbi:hypothetical protein J1N35_025963 [Gossypium stocksii]|uniref:RNase H type-1 domain-containing protein n=1 Tax=Gossypium stocksii TaxID=47602 RepID=A0A9D3ZWP1_9ROSI|nr:hypothetical protein J1N35_025963 [Gossypium stocksii]